MTDKEKIRAEIERRIEELQPCNTRENLRAHGAIAGYYQILSFINSMQEEPVSEKLEEAAFDYAEACKYDGGEKLLCVEHFKAGAKWQKERDEDEIRIIRELLDNFDKTCDEYHDAGFKHGQEALMKDATETTVHIGAGGYPYIPQMELYDYDKDIPLAKEGDKYKVVLIKED